MMTITIISRPPGVSSQSGRCCSVTPRRRGCRWPGAGAAGPGPATAVAAEPCLERVVVLSSVMAAGFLLRPVQGRLRGLLRVRQPAVELRVADRPLGQVGD